LIPTGKIMKLGAGGTAPVVQHGSEFNSRFVGGGGLWSYTIYKN
jgi:hypothetical protein